MISSSSSSTLLTASVQSTGDASISTHGWDSVNRVWLGDAAIGVADSALPDPLYVFGYGSLLFRPGDILESLESFDVVCHTHRRSFAQRSSDHRGRPHFPGLVVTLLKNEGSDGDSPSSSTNNCLGRIWKVPSDIKPALLEYLDFREKGGYSREIIEVEILGGARVKALVYTGSPSNPNFYQLHDNAQRAASIIAASSGASGENVDYLFQLQAYLHSQGYYDPNLHELKDHVIDRLSHGKIVSKYKAGRVASVFDTYLLGGSGGGACALLGWGSSEYGQLGLGALDGTVSSNKRDCLFSPAQLKAVRSLVAAVEGADEQAADGLLAHPTAKVLAGGGASGLLLHHHFSSAAAGSPGRLYLFGSAAAEGGCAAIAAATADGTTLAASAMVAEDGAPVLCIRGVRDAAIGHDHALIVADSDGLSELLQLRTGGGAPTAEWRELPAGEGVRRVAVGMSHAAVVTTSGRLHAWQLPSYTGASSIDINSWSPGEDAELLDVCCGMKSVLAVDSRGWLWLAGCNRRLGVNSPGAPVRVDTSSMGLPADVKWASVCCGWSHAVARGVRPDGSLCFVGLGRDDLCQLGGGGAGPLLLPPDVVSVWCGPEHTLAADIEGHMWSCGWGEHGNLGVGKSASLEGGPGSGLGSTWVKVDMGAMAGAREGQVACGGAHCIVLARFGQE